MRAAPRRMFFFRSEFDDFLLRIRSLLPSPFLISTFPGLYLTAQAGRFRATVGYGFHCTVCRPSFPSAVRDCPLARMGCVGFGSLTSLFYSSVSIIKLSNVVQKVLSLCKMVTARQWQSLNPLHQFKKIPTEVSELRSALHSRLSMRFITDCAQY